MAKLIIHASSLTFKQSNLIESYVGKLTSVASHFQTSLEDDFTSKKLQYLREQTQLDINIIPHDFKPEDIKLVISDMDSTLIAIECVDEIADMMNLKPQVSEITEAAMRGELDFKSSLNKRVALLKGLDESALDKVYNERLKLNPGAKTWINGLKEKGIAFALVSGGFTFFTGRLQKQLNLNFSRANTLEIHSGKLTGKLTGNIIDAQAKADYLYELCQILNISPSQVIAVGDGANDLLMMNEAALSIAYHAKPSVQSQAKLVLNHRGLDAALDVLNIS